MTIATNDNALRFRTGNTFRVWLYPEGYFANTSYSFLEISRERDLLILTDNIKNLGRRFARAKPLSPLKRILAFYSVEINLKRE